AAAQEALERGDTHQTEARGRPEYLAACAAKLERDNRIEVDPGCNLIATLGCKQGLLLSLLAVLDAGDEILIEDPSFVSYEPTIRLLGGVPVRVPLLAENRYRWSGDDLESRISTRTKAILVCSPHNPTGVVHTAQDLQVIADAARSNDLVVIVDEVYESVTWGGRKHLPLVTLPEMRDRVIGLMSLTKSHSMGGWRIGYAYGPEHLISTMMTSQQHLMTCASSFSQVGAARALEDDVTGSMKRLWQDWERRCEHVTTALDDVPGLSASMPEGAFYAWVDVSETGVGSQEFARRLLEERQVAAVPGAAFGWASGDFVRITCVRSWEEIESGLERLKSFVESL
ncbi:MAG: aminotransferase class I/II-fold pyridoxal phosphate-dependent enzyme, partial [Gammaproteobacteria bacterium]|nr:aminotransferase class I/II-fold pyridoxal phosphate-dependent enzyme [Gammaproteobacteria bacterium]